MDEVTDRQREIALAIVALTAEHLRPPTIREIGDYVTPKIRSTNAINDHLKALAKKGWLRDRAKHTVRNLVLTDLAMRMLGVPRRAA